MKKILVTSFVLLMAFVVRGQFDESLHTIKITQLKSKSDYRARNDFNKFLKDFLKTDYNVAARSTIVVKPMLKKGGTHLIEGMEAKVVGKTKLEIHIIDKISKKDSVFVYSKATSAMTDENPDKNFINSFLDDETAQMAFKLVLKAFVKESFQNNCAAKFDAVAKMKEKKNHRKTMALLANIAAENSCRAKAIQMQEDILKEQAVINCDKKIHEATLIVNSKLVFQYKKALKILLSISPDAPCAEEALALSKTMGENMKDNPKAAADLTRYEQSFSNKNDWRTFYLERLLLK